MFKKLIVLVVLIFSGAPLFAQSVDTAWVRRYNGPGNSDDAAHAIAVDDSGNVYVTGESFGGTDFDYATIKYKPKGDTAWVRRYDGVQSALDDYAVSVQVDNFGNAYVTGESRGSLNIDYATLKYYSNGDTAWVRRFNGPDDLDDYASAMTIDGSGNVYVTGYTVCLPSRTYDYLTLKYYSNGDTAWVRRYNGTGNGDDLARAIAVDTSGNVYVTGESYGSGTYGDYATIKYEPNGDTAWVRRYNGTGYFEDGAIAIAVDSSGSVYVTGYSYNGSDFDWATVKYKPDGDTAWIRRYGYTPGYSDEAYGIAVDNAGNVYVTGFSFNPGTDDDFATIKYKVNGDTAWVRRYNGPDSLNDGGIALVLDGTGNVYVTGMSRSNLSSSDYLTLKYDQNGDLLWLQKYNGPGDSIDYPHAIAIDDSRNIYVTGESHSSSSGLDFATIKYVQFLRGDANKDGKVSVSDVVYIINYLLKGGAAIDPIQAGDTNCDGKTSVSDVVYLINYLLKGGSAPCI